MVEKIWREYFTHAYRVYKQLGVRILIKILFFSILSKIARFSLLTINKINRPKLRRGNIIKEILGSKMILDLNDPGLSRQLLVDGIREAISVESFQRELKEGDCVVDIGANLGYYTLLEARLVGGSGRVYAIEPDPDNVKLLKKNIELNAFSNIEVFELAISNTQAIVPLYKSIQSNWHSLTDYSRERVKFNAGEVLDVQATTLDEFLRDKVYPRAIRMDVEGHEYEIFKGMENTLQKRLPLLIFIEFHFDLLKKQKSAEILETLKRTGFHIADAAIEERIVGLYKHRLLSKMYRATRAVIERELHRLPSGQHLNLSIDDLLSDPATLDGSNYFCMNICFKRG